MPSIFKVRTLFSGGGGGAGVNTLYFDATGGLTAQNAATAARTFWFTMRNEISNNITITPDLAVYTIDDATGSPSGLTTVTGTSFPGISTGNELPWSQQGLLEMRTGNFAFGRELRGRIFVPGAPDGDNSVGVPTSGYQTTLTAAGAALVADANSIWLVYSRTHHYSASIGSVQAWNQWAVLRSRRD